MPFIQLTLPAGVLDDRVRRGLRDTLATTLMHWEGVPVDSAFFRAQAWAQIQEVPGNDFGALGDELPRFRVDVTVPAGGLSERRRAGLIQQVTADVLAAAGLPADDAPRVWVLVREQQEGTWGAAGAVIRFADLKALAAEHRA
ncbi:tautomerase family protein [Nocardia asteroides]|uniref:tautomerase family protein n=1 Tax=Nocardia asteroides TaxID=1824 RepID=UPI001E2BC368|nr:tautomerase family protein [Nocardia asteroides]UGT62381.1 4-oxalocrotonate tautomerase family protein [Nocardia asteroides]